MSRTMRFLTVIAGVPAMIVSSPAAAQIAPGKSGTSSMHYYSGQGAWDTLSIFGSCYAVRNKTKALELVSTKADSLEEAKAYKRLFRNQDQSCLSLASELRVDYQMVRGAIAEGLYQKAVPVPATLAVAQPPSVDKVRNFMDASLCYAAAHRDEVRTLLATTRLGTKSEDKVISPIIEKFGECIPEGARSISVSSSMMRVRLAEAMWLLGESAGGAGAP